MHKPVLLSEVINALHVKSQSRYIDATLGAGGHSEEIIKAKGIVLGIDADPRMVSLAKERLNPKNGSIFVKGNFKNIDQIAKEYGFYKVSGIIFDLGISSFHLEEFERGFSFKYKESLLDMRLDPETQRVTASDLLNSLREDQLRELFLEFVGFRDTYKLAHEIIRRRIASPIATVGDFLTIIERVIKKRSGKLNPATLSFMALRIAVNSELDNLKEALPKAFSLLDKKGKLLVISFHSGEDAIVKDFFKKMAEENKGRLLNEKPIVPTQIEIDDNPKSRSAKLRIIEKI
jgi:16S rRNA (cytosine1402-N4)-methyltransferase